MFWNLRLKTYVFTPLFPTCLVISEIRHISTLFVMLSVVFVDERDASSRTWQSNLNYNNSHNWDIGRVPCETDRVVLPRSEGMVLELPGGRTALRALVLPEYSELVLPSDGLVQFSGNRDSLTCPGQGTSYAHLACATVTMHSLRVDHLLKLISDRLFVLDYLCFCKQIYQYFLGE